MPGTNLGTAYVQIVPSAQGISGSIQNVMSGEATAAGGKAGGVFSKLFSSKVAKGAMIAGAAIATGVGVGTAALKKGIQETAAYGDNVDKMSQKIGFTTDEYQKWDYVLQRAGTDIQKMQPAMKTLSTQAQSNSAAFQELGISQEQLKNMSPGELFSETVKKLSSMENQTERTALASKLLGRGATELGPLFNEGSEAIEEQMAIAEKYGMIMPEEAVKASAAFQDSVTTMQMTMTGLKNRMMSEFLPAATQITDGLGKMFAGDMSGADDVAQGIIGIANKIGEMAPVIWEAAKRIGGQLIEGIMSNSGQIGQKAVEIIGKLIVGLVTHLPQILAAGVKLIGGLAKGLINAMPQVISAVGRIAKQILTGLGSAIWGKVTQAAQGILTRFLAPIQTLQAKVKAIVDKIKGFFHFNVATPHIKVPHFSITPAGWKVGDLLKGVKPKLGITWAARGGIVDGATLVGAGEAGAEAIVPLDPFWKKMDEIANSIRQTPTANSNITVVVTLDGKEVARTTAPYMETEINRIQNRANRKLGYI